jgi:cytochrome c peroxidase
MIALMLVALTGVMVAVTSSAGPHEGAVELDRAAIGELKLEFMRPGEIPFPPDNAYTRERELLGRMLFFDPRLSGSNSMSCASCHNPSFAWGDGLARAVGNGMKSLGRRTPTIYNLAWSELLFWDGRAESLEAQALGPIQSPDEMNQDLDGLVRELQAVAGYRALFARAYPGEGITPKTIGKAIATFERTIVSGRAPFDAWVAGDETAISPEAKRGFVVFTTKARCAACHRAWNFTDDGFHDIGLRSSDPGRGKLLPLPVMQHAFKTPTLRNVERRGPYMHDGSVTTLAEVVDYYDGGGVERPSRAHDVRILGLTETEKRDLVEFMKTLTSDEAPVVVPVLPR